MSESLHPYLPLSTPKLPPLSQSQCAIKHRYKREHHVHSLVVSPTSRTLLRKLIRSRSGDFWIQLMDDSWSSPVRSAVYLLGQQVNVQVSMRHNYQGVKLFINSCYAATVNTLSQASKHSIIDNYGCLRESRINPGASRFRFSRADNVVQFSFGAFQFIEAPDAQIALHCELSVSGGGPSPMQKSCFYSHTDKRWISVFGQDSICDCCDSVCNQTKTKRITHEGK
ncbi:zona pellucida sperm-binding protein 3 [Sinocyclocheilus grahami]|uniref:zona pellucida sperm-binding protein 3 n=1 Tax=Sinocyclocheilus grahami TaxID=75366 RepID=UPI0007AD3C09|nr:PREDICTED: zona pellucida sperm-binding protein 3-like [Sinocyclocheilus grahami]